MIKLKERYFVKIIPHRGETVHRFEVQRRHLIAAALVFAGLLLGVLGSAGVQVWRAHAQVAQLQSLARAQQHRLQSIDSTTSAIRKQLLRVQHQNVEIQQLIGVHTVQKMSDVSGTINGLAAAADRTSAESNLLQRMTMRVLNVRHMRELARAAALAEIPSIDPVTGAAVVGCYCYRSEPDSEFHPGVDLGADYGDVVRAAAAGTIASAGWDGGFGQKIDIDHGNGYHTWYAHLSRMDVQPGQFVHKGQEIGLVGSTGFSTGPHLHYQIMLNGAPVDPDPYLNGVPAKVLASLP